MGLRDQMTLWLPTVFGTGFCAAVGACLGSLINVLVYRMPLGIGVVTPPSRCPACETRLTWRENVPIFGWLLLRGRCRFCRSAISPEYPLVEAFVATLFGGLYFAWYGSVEVPAWLADPAWTGNGLALTWPIFLVTLVTLGCMVAMTLVDAKTFTIPLVLAWIPALVAVVTLPAHAGWLEWRFGGFEGWRDVEGGFRTGAGRYWRCAEGWVYSLPTPSPAAWRTVGACLGAVAGLGLSAALVRMGLIRPSFADYDAWEEGVRAEAAARGESGEAEGPEIWTLYPHARREMVKELAFLGPPAILALAGSWLAVWLVTAFAGPWSAPAPFTGESYPPVGAPLWLLVLTGTLLGYLVGGGIVWAIRILGSLLFGKEAMGIGDVHLMAGVGACFGWIDVTLGFFAAGFVGLAWTLLAAVAQGKLRRAMPFGPFLVIGTALVVLLKPVVSAGITLLLSSPTPLTLP